MTHSRHGVRIEELLGHISHVDVPEFVLVGVRSGSICHGGKAVLHVLIHHRGLERTTERVDGNSCICDGAVAVGIEYRQRFPEFALAVVLVRGAYQPGFRVNIEDPL